MDSYGVFADFYDQLTLNVDYEKRAGYILDVFKNLGHDMGITLDLACGTGKLTVELKKRGVDIYGVDASEDMLTRAFQNCAEEGLSILFLHQKMQELNLYGSVDTCVCTLDSINHMINPDDVLKTFERVSLFMNPDGYFLFDVNSVYKHKKILADNTFVYDLDEVYCVWENSLKENNIVDIDINLFIPEGDLYLRDEEHFSERAYSDEEISAMLKKAGFEVKARYGDMSFDPPKTDEQRVIYIAKKI
ncbi:MAG: methyltransferase domain-containing protein [Ruminococcus sp.]|nr:methyltransferase domain-containing protein [Ruminococcus sp.]